MYLMQIFVPYGNSADGALREEPYMNLKQELTDRFGGVTVYSRAPVKGIWKPAPGQQEADDMIIYEVLLGKPDMSYWSSLKSRLEYIFQQQEILMRYYTVSIVK